MIIGKNSILDYFDQVGKPYFALFYKGQVEKGNAVMRNDKDDVDVDLSSGRLKFESQLSILSSGEYTIVISDGKDVTKRGNNRVDFRIPVSEGVANAPAAGNGIGSVSMDQVESKANEIAVKKFQELMNEKELKDTKEKNLVLEKEIKELQRSVSEPFNKLITALSPHAPAIISGLFPNSKLLAPSLAGTGTADAVGTGTEAENAEENQKIFEGFATALVTARPNDWKDILCRLTTLINENPGKFETALNFL